ncbi:MAG: cupin domain-containing protein [Epulopiscium sp.]|nr:cupin domain-containing protein [Candidatus Epulonipiscium sp.]
MVVRNYIESELNEKSSHSGKGLARSIKLFNKEDFSSGLNFLYYMELDPGVSIGEHTHQDDEEEMYVILEGYGTMNINGEFREVKQGDVILNRPGWSHGLENTSSQILKILAFEVSKDL